MDCHCRNSESREGSCSKKPRVDRGEDRFPESDAAALDSTVVTFSPDVVDSSLDAVEKEGLARSLVSLCDLIRREAARAIGKRALSSLKETLEFVST